MFTKKFWKDLAERTGRTFLQGVAAFATGITLNMVQADLKSVVVGGLLAGGYAVLTGLIAAFKNPEQQTASLLDQPVVTVPGRHDGSQASYDASVESYRVSGEQQLADAGLPAEYTDGPTDLPPSPYQYQVPIAENRPIPQRDPGTGRFLPRNQGDG